MLTDDQRREIEQTFGEYCERRVPLWVRDEVALQFRIQGQDIVLFEKRPQFNDPSNWIESNVAKFRFNGKAGKWSLLWRDRNSRWHHYERCEASTDIGSLLDEVDKDPTGIFWG